MARCRLLSTAMAALIMVALGACTGSIRGGVPENLPGAEPPAALGDAFGDLGAPPRNPPLSESAIRAKRAEALIDWRHSGNDTFARHDDSVPDKIEQTLALSSAPQQFQWAMYQYSYLLDTDKTLAVTVEQSGLPQAFYLGLSDYGRGRWDWRFVSAPTGADQCVLPDTLDCINAGGAVYVAVVAYGGSAVTVQSVTLQTDVAAPPPQNFSAGDGARGDGVQLSWTDPAVSYPGLDYDHIVLERSSTLAGPWTQVGQAPAHATTYFDLHEGAGAGENNIPYAEEMCYRARTCAGELTGVPSAMDTGYRRLSVTTGVSATDGAYPDRVAIT